jgi:hypothetical protein
MVLRSEGFKEFVGTVVDVTLESNDLTEEKLMQYHISIKPEGKVIKGKTGMIHEWIRLTKTAKEDSVPEGSVLDNYLKMIEMIIPAAKRAATLDEAFGLLKGKKFLWKKVKLGKAYAGHEAKEYWVCTALK